MKQLPPHLADATDRLFDGDDSALRALTSKERLVILLHLMIRLVEKLEEDAKKPVATWEEEASRITEEDQADALIAEVLVWLDGRL